MTIENNTGFQSGAILNAAGKIPGANLVFRNNITPHNTYGVKGDAAGVGLTTLDKFFPGYLFTSNVIISNPLPQNYPHGNHHAADRDAVGFANAAAGDYRLAPGSAYAKKGTDGADIGVDWTRLRAATSTAESNSAPDKP